MDTTKKVKILFDYQIFAMQKHGGISRYFHEVIKSLKSENTADIRIAMSHSKNKYLTDDDFSEYLTDYNRARLKLVEMAEIAEKRKIVRGIEWRLGFRASNALYDNQASAVRYLEMGDYQVFHPTHYDPYFLRYLNKRPFVLTVYDMIEERWVKRCDDLVTKDGCKGERAEMADFRRTVAWKRELIEKADSVIAISESTKRDIIDILGADENKIKVIYLATSIDPRTSGSISTTLPEKYVLYIGMRTAHKNFGFMLQSLIPLLQDQPRLSLVCVGGGPFDAIERDQIEKNQLKQRIVQLDASNEELPAIYTSAIAYICPSLYEGFGIPTLEAMQCGCPAILSDTTSLPEVGGSAAAYFDAKNCESLRTEVEKVVEDPELQKEMRERGLKQASRFSWQKTASETMDVYRSLL